MDVPFDVFDVFIQGDRATAKLAYGSRTQSEVIDLYTFTRVGGRWYISGVETQPNPNLMNQTLESPSSASQR